VIGARGAENLASDFGSDASSASRWARRPRWVGVRPRNPSMTTGARCAAPAARGPVTIESRAPPRAACESTRPCACRGRAHPASFRGPCFPAPVKAVGAGIWKAPSRAPSIPLLSSFSRPRRKCALGHIFLRGGRVDRVFYHRNQHPI